MGGKTGTTTQSVTIPPEVLARYNSVNATAQNTASTPFQSYSSDPSSFVAPVNAQQTAGIDATNNYANLAQPYYAAAGQATANTMGGLTPGGFQSGVQGYMDPYLNSAMAATAAQLNNTNQQQQQQFLGNQVMNGSFGGDRTGVGLAALMNQQNLATGQTLSGMANQGYQNAAQNYLTAQGQQGALANQLGTLGAGAQAAGLSGAQAQMGAGTLQQQTTQAGDTALYNQFLQQQAYPFQVAQFLANIAEGTGSLSGSTTTTTQPMPFFSDRRLKENIRKIGVSKNGLPIYKFNYKHDPAEQTHIGYMADEVEKVHPEAVGLAGGYKTVDYDAASRPRRYAGGLVSEDRGHYAYGGSDMSSYNPYDPNSLQNIIARHEAMYSGITGEPTMRNTGLNGKGRVPSDTVPVHALMAAGSIPKLPEATVTDPFGDLMKASNMYDHFKPKVQSAMSSLGSSSNDNSSSGTSNHLVTSMNDDDAFLPISETAYRGGLIREHKAGGGPLDDAAAAAQNSQIAGDDDVLSMYSPTTEDKNAEKRAIPGTHSSYRLNTPGAPPSPTSQTGIGLGDALKGLGFLGGLFGFEQGGRVGLAGGGQPDSDTPDPSDQPVALEPFKGKGPLNLRYSNPGALIDNDYTHTLPGYVGSAPGADGRVFAQFDTPENGYRAANKNLDDTYIRHGLTTPNQIIHKWAPAADDNNPDAYVRRLKSMGFDPDTPIGSDPDSRAKFLHALTNVEAGQESPWNAQQISAALGAKGSGSAAPEYKDFAATDSSSSGPRPLARNPEGGLSPSYLAPQAQQPPGVWSEIGQKLGLPDFMQSKDFWYPVAAGLSGMARSRSPFLIGAMMEGAGDAAAASMANDRQNADIEAERVGTAGNIMEQARKSMFNYGGTLMVSVVGLDGKITAVPYSQFKAHPELYTPNPLGTVGSENGTTSAPKAPGLGGASPATPASPASEPAKAPGLGGADVFGANDARHLGSAGAGLAGTDVFGANDARHLGSAGAGLAGAAVAPKASEPKPAPQPAIAAVPANDLPAQDEEIYDGGRLSPEALKRVNAAKTQFIDTTNDTLAPQAELGRKIYTDQAEGAAELSGTKQQFNHLVSTLSSLPRTGLQSPGPAQGWGSKIAGLAGEAAHIFGYGSPVNASTQGDYEFIKKNISSLEAQAASEGHQHAAAALHDLGNQWPSGENSNEGIAKGMASSLVSRQRAIDRGNYVKNFANSAVDPDRRGSLTNYAAVNAAQPQTEFDTRYNPKFNQEQKALEYMLRETSDAKDRSGNPMSWFSKIEDQGGKLDLQKAQTFVKAINKQAGTNVGMDILRYFDSIDPRLYTPGAH